ncbi:MAG TPA: flagellar hook-basal body protein [Clostridiaceae bacterium]|jgi:flagellar basal-body rod protein FlgF|nr:flagellar hook-basal body protein [Clostridiaceae bacterium]
MIRGLYTSGYSMLTLNRKMDVVSNNLANVNTNGFKKDFVVFEEFSDVLAKRFFDGSDGSARPVRIGNMTLYNDIAEVYTDFTQGALESTGLSTDVAINGDESAFFCVAVPVNDEFREFYTRDGGFKLDAQGRLVTRDGYTVMGENGVIVLEGSDFVITREGEVIQNGETVDTLRIRKFENPESLRKYGFNLLTATEESQDAEFEGTIEQGFIERSNVDSVREMVDMITVLRAYESNQKLIHYQDSTLDKAVNDIGKV